MTKDEALRIALEALVDLGWHNENCPQFPTYRIIPHSPCTCGYDTAITALRQALEQPECNQHPDAPHGFNRDASHSLGRYVCDCEGWEQEPVAWRYKIVDCFGRPVWTLKTPKTDTRVLESQPLYTSPPPQRKPLTDEQIDNTTRKQVDDLLDHIYEYGTAAEGIDFRVRAIARAIEAAHGIGEKK